MGSVLAHRRKWNLRYGEKLSPGLIPEPHFLARDWAHRFSGGPMLDAACGLGRGIAGAVGAFDPIFAVDISDVALQMAKRRFSKGRRGGRQRIHWIVGDVTQMAWPPNFFGLVCAFGFTDLGFFATLHNRIMPGGMFLYEGFSVRQIEVKPGLTPDWTTTKEGVAALFPGWEVLALGESRTPPFRVHLAAVKPT